MKSLLVNRMANAWKRKYCKHQPAFGWPYGWQPSSVCLAAMRLGLGLSLFWIWDLGLCHIVLSLSVFTWEGVVVPSSSSVAGIKYLDKRSFGEVFVCLTNLGFRLSFWEKLRKELEAVSHSHSQEQREPGVGGARL